MGSRLNRPRVVPEHWSQEIDWSHPSSSHLIYAIRFEPANMKLLTGARRGVQGITECVLQVPVTGVDANVGIIRGALGKTCGIASGSTSTTSPVNFNANNDQFMRQRRGTEWALGQADAAITFVELREIRNHQSATPQSCRVLTQNGDVWSCGWLPDDGKYMWIHEDYASTPETSFPATNTRTLKTDAVVYTAHVYPKAAALIDEWVDGLLDLSHSFNTGTVSGVASRWYHGSGPNRQQLFNGQFGVAYFWRRAITWSEARSFYADPMQLFIDRRRDGLVPAAAAGAVAGSGAMTGYGWGTI